MPVSEEFFKAIEKTINQHLIDHNWVFSFHMRQDELAIIREGMKLDFPNHERREAQYLEDLQKATTTNFTVLESD